MKTPQEVREEKLQTLYDDKFSDFIQHTIYHWGSFIGPEKFDYWPSKHKFMYKKRIVLREPDKVREVYDNLKGEIK